LDIKDIVNQQEQSIDSERSAGKLAVKMPVFHLTPKVAQRHHDSESKKNNDREEFKKLNFSLKRGMTTKASSSFVNKKTLLGSTPRNPKL